MMNQREESTKEIIDRLSQSGLSFEALNVLEKYFIGDIEEKKLSGVLMNEDVDFNGVYSDWHEIFYNYIRSDEELIDKFIKVLFLIFKEKAFDIYVMSYIIGEDIDKIYIKLKKLNIPFYYYIVNKAQEIDKENPYYYHARFFIKYFRNLKNMYKKYKEDYIKAFNYAAGNVKLYLAIEILRKDCNEVENLEEYINEALKKFVFEFFNCDYNNEEKINNYLNGEEEYLEEVVDILKNSPNVSATNSDSLKKITMVVYNCCKRSEFGRRILKLLSYVDVKNTVDNIFDFSCAAQDDYRRYRKKIQGQLEEFLNKLKELGIPDNFYLVWVADQYFNDDIYESDREYLKKVINEYLNHDIEGFKKAAKLSDGIAKEYLEHYLWKLKNDDELIEEAKDKCIKNVKEVLIECDFETKEIDDFILYMEGEKEIEKVLKPSKFKNNDNIYGYHIRNYLKRIVWYSDVNEIFNKVVRYFIQLQNGKLFDYLIDEFINENDSNFNRFMSIVDSLQVGIKELLPLLSYNEFEGHHGQKCYELSSKWIKNKPYEVSKYIHLCRAEGRVDLINRIYESNFVKEDREEFKKILLKFTADSSKTVRECVMNIINEALSNDECKKIFIPLLNNKKAAVREGAVKVLVSILDEECISVLKEQLEKEKSSKVKNIIIESLNIETEDTEQESMLDINEYCKKNLNKRKKAKIEWLHPNTLPALILKESGQEAGEDTLHYMLISFADNKEVQINSEVKNMMSFFTQCSLADIALESLERWCEVGAEAKKKWILSLVGMFGDTKCVQFLEKHIKEWPKKSRGAIACEALKALAMIGSDETLMIIDSIARKFKFKQVKKAASEALDFAAKELGIDKEELSDRVVPTLGFDENGQRVFDYGNRKFIIEINPELKLEVYNEAEKKLKNLPAVGKNDNEEMATKAREEFKTLKKQLKTLVDVQSTRLEMALSANRKWKLDKWKKLFVENVIMHRFAIGLVWGVYEENKLFQSFRYIEDGTFNTVDDEEFQVLDNAEIGLVHPVELKEEERESWKEQLEDYEISQPIEQLDRKIFVLEDEKSINIDKFGGKVLNGTTLLNKLTKRGWYTGSVRDGGWYEEFYKEDENCGIGAEIEFSGMGFYDPYETVTVFVLRFYKAGTVERGSYIYDTIKKENLILPKDLPERLFSEIMYDVYIATMNSSEFDDKWRTEMKNVSNYGGEIV